MFHFLAKVRKTEWIFKILKHKFLFFQKFYWKIHKLVKFYKFVSIFCIKFICYICKILSLKFIKKYVLSSYYWHKIIRSNHLIFFKKLIFFHNIQYSQKLYFLIIYWFWESLLAVFVHNDYILKSDLIQTVLCIAFLTTISRKTGNKLFLYTRTLQAPLKEFTSKNIKIHFKASTKYYRFAGQLNLFGKNPKKVKIWNDFFQ